ncbi:MAG: helix-turn-helix domain-containing protein [Oscillospiraceae bacterium]|nr:helix-turn-helix domain-containing protein [Oscillospiraceae bacterium]
MKDRQYYEIQLCQYPDVMKIAEVRKALGGVSEKTIKNLIDQDKIQYFKLRNTLYRFPKSYVIDFMVSKDYEALCRNVEIHRCRFCKDGDEKIRRKILLLCEQPRTRRELMYMVDVDSIKTFKRLYLQPLLDSGQLKMTVPGRKSISTQKYVRVKD